MIIYYIIMIDDMGLIASDSESGVLHPAVVAVADIPGAGHGVGTPSVIILDNSVTMVSAYPLWTHLRQCAHALPHHPA